MIGRKFALEFLEVEGLQPLSRKFLGLQLADKLSHGFLQGVHVDLGFDDSLHDDVPVSFTASL
jgi:hypothetical protein